MAHFRHRPVMVGGPVRRRDVVNPFPKTIFFQTVTWRDWWGFRFNALVRPRNDAIKRVLLGRAELGAGAHAQ